MACPIEFVLAQGACVVKCPSTYTLQVVDGIPSCVMKNTTGRVIASFGLTSVLPMTPGGPSGTLRGRSYTAFPADFKNAYNDFTQKLAVANSSVDRNTATETAFAALQTAENARGTPAGESAYEAARIAYYTLTKGDAWLADEQTRIANTEAQPVIDNLVAQYTALHAKNTQQQSTIEVINGLKDRVLSVKDDLAFSVNTFQRQVEVVKNQINMDRKAKEVEAAAASSWVDSVLNWLIAIITIVCIVLIIRRFTGGRNSIEKMRQETEFYRAKAGLERAKKGDQSERTPNLYELFGLERPTAPAAAPAAPK